MREYQSWHLSVEAELTGLKEEKKNAKYDYKLAGNVLVEKTYSVQAVELENEVVMDANEVVMPEYVEMRSEEDARTENVWDEYAQNKYVSVRSDSVECVDMGSAKNEEFDIAVVTERHEEITARDYSDVETEDSLQVKDGDDVVVVSLVESSDSSETGFEKNNDLPQNYTEYMSLTLEKRVELQGITDEKPIADILSVVKRNFDKAGYHVSFDEKYDETMAIERYIAERKSVDRAEVIADKSMS